MHTLYRVLLPHYRGRLIAHIEHLYTKRNEILKTIADGQTDSAVIESALAFIREELMLSLDANLGSTSPTRFSNPISRRALPAAVPT